MVDVECFGIMGQPCKKTKKTPRVSIPLKNTFILKVTRRLYTGYNEKTIFVMI